MDINNFTFHRRAFFAFNQLTSSEQTQVLEKLDKYAETPEGFWASSEAQKVPGDPPLYLLPVNDSLRLLVQERMEQKSEVMDIVRQETLETFRHSTVSSGQ